MNFSQRLRKNMDEKGAEAAKKWNESLYKNKKWIVVENYSSMYEAMPALFDDYVKAKEYYDVMVSDGTNIVLAQILEENE